MKEELDKIIKTKKTEDIVKSYKKTIEEKQLNIDLLKSKLYDIENSNLKPGEKFIVINFKLGDDLIIPITCRNKMVFKDVENQLYMQYPEYKNNENYFMFGDYKIGSSNKSKKLEEIGIHGYTLSMKRN